MTDNKLILECPACGCEMKKIYSKESDTNVDICLDGCGGMFFDNRELQKFDDNNDNIDEILQAIEGKDFKTTDEREVRICPICNVPMVKMGAGKGEVEIDVCNTCGGKFLDNGELQKIRNTEKINDNKLDEIIENLYRKELHQVLGNNPDIPVKSSPRRMFVENLVKKLIK